ncbi:XRE family transcriptional regulator [Streptococcus sp. zg-JUN1979]|uniref:XRE family transcriptional regulator n=1 Tax=Streptococcus sp. zg-JUN1979 TaxID=3391450 RepID=UPI0039A5437E
MTPLTTKVERLLASELTTYRIGKDAKVNDVSIDRYRKGKASIANMPLGVAEKLGAYSDKYFKAQKEDKRLLFWSNLVFV